MKYKRNTVSVIIPVYNTGIYLEKCLNSVIESDYKDIDIILINDGSKDDVTLEILDKYKNTSNNLINKTPFFIWQKHAVKM